MVKRNGLRPAALPGMLGVVVSQQMRSRRFQSTDLKGHFFNKASQVLRNLERKVFHKRTAGLGARSLLQYQVQRQRKND